jgi:hypothetical protein
VTTPHPNLAELLGVACEFATPEALGLVILRADPQIRHLAETDHLPVVRSALAEGQATAARLRNRFGQVTPRSIANQLGLVIRESDESALRGSALFYAEYCRKQSEIVLFRRALLPLQAALADSDVARHFNVADLSGVFIAHELYHHVESTRDEPPIARRHRVTLFSVGRLRWSSGLASLGEIAAGSCAQTLLCLNRHPKLLDLIALHQVDPLAASAMLRSLREAAELEEH